MAHSSQDKMDEMVALQKQEVGKQKDVSHKESSGAMGEILVGAYPKLLRFATAYVRDKIKAEDFVMDAIERVLRSSKSNDIGNVEAYTITIIKNLVKDDAKKHKPIYGEVPDVADKREPGGIEDIKRVFFRLGEQCQEILDLFGLGYSYAELSEALDIPPGTVASRKARCSDNFRQELER